MKSEHAMPYRAAEFVGHPPFDRGVTEIIASTLSQMDGEGITSGMARLRATTILAELWVLGFKVVPK